MFFNPEMLPEKAVRSCAANLNSVTCPLRTYWPGANSCDSPSWAITSWLNGISSAGTLIFWDNAFLMPAMSFVFICFAESIRNPATPRFHRSARYAAWMSCTRSLPVLMSHMELNRQFCTSLALV